MGGLQLQVMSERKSWSEEEDKALKQLYQERGMRRWAEIARAMERQFRIRGRSGKQCRERYYNHLDTTIKTGSWSDEEEEELMRIHSRVGNRWAEISRAIPGRSENCVKNKFYSILRRGLRCINKAIKTSLKKYNEIDINTVFKIVEACELAYKRKTLSRQMVENLEIKKEIVFYGLNPQNNEPELNSRIKKLIDRIKAFGKNSPKKAKGEEKEEESEVESAEEEDKMPMVKVEKVQVTQPQSTPTVFPQMHNPFQPQIPQPQTVRRESFQFVVPPPAEVPERERTEQGDYRYPVGHNLANLIAQSGGEAPQINYFDKTPRQGGLLDGNWTVRSFEVPEFENMRSPRPLGFIQSPYFDQLRGTNSLNSFNPLYPQ